jgi:hypothetical protein
LSNISKNYTPDAKRVGVILLQSDGLIEVLYCAVGLAHASKDKTLIIPSLWVFPVEAKSLFVV